MKRCNAVSRVAPPGPTSNKGMASTRDLRVRLGKRRGRASAMRASSASRAA